MSFFFFNDTATTEIYTLSLHDALPISAVHAELRTGVVIAAAVSAGGHRRTCSTGPISYGLPIHSAIDGSKAAIDRKSTRLNSSHGYISYAVFCLKKKKKKNEHRRWIR